MGIIVLVRYFLYHFQKISIHLLVGFALTFCFDGLIMVKDFTSVVLVDMLGCISLFEGDADLGRRPGSAEAKECTCQFNFEVVPVTCCFFLAGYLATGKPTFRIQQLV